MKQDEEAIKEAVELLARLLAFPSPSTRTHSCFGPTPSPFTPWPRTSCPIPQVFPSGRHPPQRFRGKLYAPPSSKASSREQLETTLDTSIKEARGPGQKGTGVVEYCAQRPPACPCLIGWAGACGGQAKRGREKCIMEYGHAAMLYESQRRALLRPGRRVLDMQTRTQQISQRVSHTLSTRASLPNHSPPFLFIF